MKPSEHPLSPFNPNYQAKISWDKQQQAAKARETVSKRVEQKRLANPNFDKTIGMNFSDKMAEKPLPKKFNVFSKAAPKK